MKYLKIAFGLAMVAGLMAVAATPALALSPRWVVCEKVEAGKGQWEDSRCTKPKGGGGWETKEVKETREVTSDGTLELEDEKASIAGPTRVKCSGTNLGTIGAGGTDSVTEITATNCRFVTAGGCKENLEKLIVRPVNLPWSTLLEEREGAIRGSREVRDIIRSLTAGRAPGWTVKCESVLGGQEEDVCEAEGGFASTKITNGEGALQGAVIGTFEKGVPKNAKCSKGGAGTGVVEGTVLSRLRTSPSGELRSFWVLAAAFKT